jgi:diguanylate cyclase (GGDEF)-like protein
MGHSAVALGAGTPADIEGRRLPGAAMMTPPSVAPGPGAVPSSIAVQGIGSRSTRIPDLYHDAAWLRRVGLLAALIGLLAAAVEGALWLSSDDPDHLGVALMAAALATWLAFVGRCITDGRERWGVALMSAGAFGAVVLMLGVIPEAGPILALSMLVPLLLAIPYLESRDLAMYCVGVWTSAMALVVVAAFIGIASGAGSDGIAQLARDLLAAGTIMALLMVLLVRYHHAVNALRRMALHDGLTDLYNRDLFVDRLEHALARQRRHGRTRTATAVIYVDLDDFKSINDRHGHAQGDRVLRAISARLSEGVRAADTVARVGGDEFAVLLEDVADRADATTILERVMSTLSLPIAFPGGAEAVRASAGLAVSGAGIETAETLLDDADRAMYRVKGVSRGAAVADPPARLPFEGGTEARAGQAWPFPLARHPSR